MSDELQVGQSKEYSIAGRTLRLKPMTLGKMKKATTLFAEKEGDNMDRMAKYLFAILDNGDNGDLTVEWVTDNVTLPQANQIITDCKIINGLGQVFQTGAAGSAKQERELSETQPTPSV